MSSGLPKYRAKRPTPIWAKDRQVLIEQWTETGVDARGQSEGSWGTLATVWANLEPLTGRSAEYAHQLYAQATHRVFIDYRSDVTKAMRLTYDGSRVYYIGYVLNRHESDVTLELLCTEGDP